MARVLVVYGTTEGHTRKIAGFVAGCIREHGHDAEVVDSTEVPAGLDVAAYDGVIVAASLHMGRHQTAVAHFVQAHADVLNDRPTAFLSVGLWVATNVAHDLAEARASVDRFLEQTGWRPTRTELVAGAFRYTQYDFFKRWTMKLIARHTGMPSDTSQDYELTDWAALRETVADFLGRLSGASAGAG